MSSEENGVKPLEAELLFVSRKPSLKGHSTCQVKPTPKSKGKRHPTGPKTTTRAAHSPPKTVRTARPEWNQYLTDPATYTFDKAKLVENKLKKV